jgi:hypothetical protein
MKWSFSSNCSFIWRGLMLNQENYNVHASHETGHVEWGQTRLEIKEKKFGFQILNLPKFFLWALMKKIGILRNNSFKP